MKGYTGKILRLDLTNRKILTIDTKKYEEWVGGHGIGTAIFWDLCEDKTVSGFDPKNVVTIMTSPMSGGITPSASSRTEIQGIGVQSLPVEWFTRSNVGGRFGAMLKFAGWDGIVLEGKADSPIWVDIINDKVKIKDANGLWGLDTWETQQTIWSKANKDYDEWNNLNSSRDGGRTTQKSAILAIGPTGEKLSRLAAIVHDAGNGAGQGGFGAVWGSKNLKAISVIGTGGVEVDDPNTMLQARIELSKHNFDVDDPDSGMINTKSPGYAMLSLPMTEDNRPQGCTGCFINCRRRTASGHGNESSCVDVLFAYRYSGNAEEQLEISDMAQKLAINVFPLYEGTQWLISLYEMGILGAGKQIHSDLPFDIFGTHEFYKAFLNAIAYRTDIGDDLAEGFVQAAIKWGREEDLETGLLAFPQWGYPQHYDPRLEVEWSYCSILFSRDFNDHTLNNYVYWLPMTAAAYLGNPEAVISAEDMVKTMTEQVTGVYHDPLLLDYSEEGIYSDSKVKMVSYMIHYNLFWKSTLLYCDWAWPALINLNREDNKGYTPEYEPIFFNAAVGTNITFAEGMEMGRRLWNLERSILVLQGKHRDMEVHSGYVYNVPTTNPNYLPVEKDGKWHFDLNIGRILEKEKFEGWKTKYYASEGWDTNTGWPTRKTLESLNLKYVADGLEAQDKLGSE